MHTTRNTCFLLIKLHAIGNPLHVIHKCTVHEGVGLASTSNTQVTRVHAGEKGDTQVRSSLSTGTL